MCITNGWRLVEKVIESGKSAYHGRNRLSTGELGKLEAQAAQGELAGMVLIMENVDRLSRQEPLQGLNLLQNLTTAGVTVAKSSKGTILDAETVRENWQSLLVPFLSWGLSYEESRTKGKRVSKAYRATVDRNFRTKSDLADLCFSPSWIGRDLWLQAAIAAVSDSNLVAVDVARTLLSSFRKRVSRPLSRVWM